MNYKHECYGLEKLLLADDDFLLYLFGGDNVEALRTDLKLRYEAGDRLITTQNCPDFSPVRGCPGHNSECVDE